MFPHNIFEDLAVVATIDPDAYAADTYLTDAIDMSVYRRVGFIIQVGTMGTDATIDFTIQEADGASGSYVDIGGASSPTFAITQLTQAGTDQSDTQVLIEVKAEDLSAGNTHIKGELVIGTAACDAAVLAVGAVAREMPVTHLASVTSE
jgi:hypothetical protein